MTDKHKSAAPAPVQAPAEPTPQEGGRYQRLPDGSLARLPDATPEQPA